MSTPDTEAKERYAAEHRRLREALKARIIKSIAADVGPDPRTLADPARAAEYAVNALMEWPAGEALLRQIVVHIESRAEQTGGEVNDEHS